VGYNASAVCKNLQRFVLRLENNFFILLFKNAVAYYNAGVEIVKLRSRNIGSDLLFQACGRRGSAKENKRKSKRSRVRALAEPNF
jgi:hypothetical protein